MLDVCLIQSLKSLFLMILPFESFSPLILLINDTLRKYIKQNIPKLISDWSVGNISSIAIDQSMILIYFFALKDGGPTKIRLFCAT